MVALALLGLEVYHAARGRARFPESLLRMAASTVRGDRIGLRRVITADLPHLLDGAAP